MSGPTTAREALIVEALGEVALLLDRMETVTSSMEVGRLAFINAGADLEGRLKDFDMRTASIAQQVQARAVEHIVRRTSKVTSDSIESQARAVNMAARLAFLEQADSSLARLMNALQQVLQRVDRPWDLWLTHAATAAVSAWVTWWLFSSLPPR